MSLIVLQQYISILRSPEANTKKDLRKAHVMYIYINVYTLTAVKLFRSLDQIVLDQRGLRYQKIIQTGIIQ